MPRQAAQTQKSRELRGFFVLFMSALTRRPMHLPAGQQMQM